jgi:hypothetical protein
MTTLTNAKGTIEVVIRKNGEKSFYASYCLIRPQEWCSQVLQSKMFASKNNAEKWAKKMLGI